MIAVRSDEVCAWCNQRPATTQNPRSRDPMCQDCYDRYWLNWNETRASEREEQREELRATESLYVLPERDESAADVCAATPDETNWYVPGFIAEASVTEIDGKVKLGKTSLALDMVRALLSAGDFLGLRCQQISVVYVTEQGRPSFTKGLRRAGLEAAFQLYPVFWLEHRGKQWPDLVQHAVDKCQRVKAALLVIDTISKLAGVKDENQAGEMASAIEPLQVRANGTGIAVLVLRHDRKSGGEVGDSGRGSSQMTGDADIVIQLTRPEGNHPRNRRQLNRISRFDDENSILIERREDNTFVNLGSADGYAAEQARTTIMEAFAYKPMSGDDLAKHLSQEKLTGTQLRTLTELLKEGKLHRSGTGRRGNPYLYQLAGGPEIDSLQ